VARKAGVTPALIHNTYPDVAEQIRAITGREPTAVRSKEAQTLLALQATNKRLHQENTQLNADVARLASIAQTLTDEIARLRAVAAGKVSEMVKQSPP
jgi:cell division protein FtsB